MLGMARNSVLASQSALLLGLGSNVTMAQSRDDMASSRPQELRGNRINLVIEEKWVNFTGKPQLATVINGSLPAPTLRLREGDDVIITVTNRLGVRSSIHWHGIILPYQMDGVPGISYAGIDPGTSFEYRFKLQQHGTYWYHAHSGFQEMTGLYGALIVEPRDGDAIASDSEHVVLLSEWTDENPEYLFQKLKTKGHLYNFNQPTLPELLSDVRSEGLSAAINRRQMFSQMRMKPTDLADLSSATLTYLCNGVPPAENATLAFSPGQRVRLRVINAAGNTFFDVRIPGLEMNVVAVDGLEVEPVDIDEFRCGPGETYDVIVTPTNSAYTLFAETMERTGYALATLASREGARAEIPEPREPQWLSMTDMMGAGHAQHDGMHAMPGMDHSAAMSVTVRHASTEYGPGTDMRIDTPRINLDDPGIGLRGATHRVLTLGDLRSKNRAPDTLTSEREIELHMTGNMERYAWSIDGLEYGKSSPIHFRHGERLRVHLHNDTMMTHPMHLHGMWSDVEDGHGNFLVRRHTIPVQPAQRVSFSVTADALGRWAWHCHLLLHMDAGMFREVIVT
jgi:CopA family copper-resistance protein